ncbi:hypothetical protein [Marinobacterium sp. BA1]|uniref:hypothetical protein n=1 Tax=Marinobacterium sp. BA1 TaxID=3138931 RepID=UPI0032E6DA62
MRNKIITACVVAGAVLTPHTTWSAESASDPCASPQALQIFSGRMGGARDQSVTMSREHGKSVGDTSISESSVRKSRQCNDLLRDALMEVFAGTPIDDILGLLGMDKSSCDGLYDFIESVDPDYDFDIPEDFGGIRPPPSLPLPGSNPTSPKPEPPKYYQWVPTGKYSPCSSTQGVFGTQQMIYQCMDNQMQFALPSMCASNPPVETRACRVSTLSDSTGVSDAIY